MLSKMRVSISLQSPEALGQGIRCTGLRPGPLLVKRLREMHFDVRKFTDRTLYANRRMLKDYQEDNPDPIPLLYQSGYLTIVGSDARGGILILGFPMRRCGSVSWRV